MPITLPKSDLPEDLDAAAAEQDALVGEELASLIPPFEKPIKAIVMENLGKALASVLAIMGMEGVEAQPYDGPVEAIDPDMVRMLMAVSMAAQDYGQPFPVAIEDIRGDQEITAITAALTGLAADRDFKDWLKEQAEAPEAEEEVIEEEAADAGDDFFAARTQG